MRASTPDIQVPCAFTEIYRRFYVRLINYARLKTGDIHVAEDLVHDLFADLYLRPVEVQNMESYLFTALKRRVLNHWRHQAVRLKYLEQKEPVKTHDRPYLSAEVKDLMNDVHRQLDHLPPQSRQVFLMKKAEYTNKEIATEMKVSIKTVEAHYTRVRNFLKKNVRYHDALILVAMLKNL